MRIRLAFHRSEDDRFLVLCEDVHGTGSTSQGDFSVTTFADENDFLEQVVLSNLGQDTTLRVVTAVLISVTRRSEQEWVSLSLTRQQYTSLGLVREIQSVDPADIRAVMLQTPTPFVLLSGPEHRFAFINDPYVELLRRRSAASVLGRTVREALPELEGQPFFGLLDRVYRTGKPYIGRAIPGLLRNERTGQFEQHYFDFVYHPMQDSTGEVCGIMAQATDVTSIILDKQVSTSREQQLYKQWAELESIYRYSPMSMCLIDVKTFSILRLNDLAAEQFGGTREALTGVNVCNLFPDRPELFSLFETVMRGEVVRNQEFTLEHPRGSGVVRSWLLTMSPLFDEAGNVEMIESIGVEVTERLGRTVDSSDELKVLTEL